MSSNLQNSIWPNAGGTLGQNKVQIPDGVTTPWPEGDALVHNFVFNKGRLVGFVDTKALIANSSKTTTFPYDYVNIHLDSITEGEMNVEGGAKPEYLIVTFGTGNSGDDNVIVTLKYKGCKTINDVKAVDPDYLTNDIVDGIWSEGLGDLEDGNSMFYECNNLTSFSSDLSSLINGNWMFGYTNLKSFSSDLSSLKKASSMFYHCRKLTSFSSSLPSLTDGYYMFYNCKLDAPSVKNIIDTINTYSAKLSLGMGCNNTTEDKDLFAQEAGYADMVSLLTTLQAKGWTISFQFNGRPTTTYGLRRPSEDTLPIFVKLEEVDEHADYTSLDDSKKYRLNYFHETTGSTDGYTQFNSLEEAIAHFNIKPIERN